MAKKVPMVKINDKEYKQSDLSEECLAQLKSIQFCDQELSRLNAQISLVKTARNAYEHGLASLLPKA